MATERAFLANAGGQIGSANARLTTTVGYTFVVNGNATYSAIIPIPQGTWITSVASSTATALAGTPTSANLRVGITAAGAEITADLDVKAQQNSTGTVVASFDRYGNVATNLYLQLIVAGGTAPTGVVNVAITLHSPN